MRMPSALAARNDLFDLKIRDVGREELQQSRSASGRNWHPPRSQKNRAEGDQNPKPPFFSRYCLNTSDLKKLSEHPPAGLRNGHSII